MSKLKISDLSFCETELSPNSQVQGGVSFSPFSDLSAYFYQRFEELREAAFNSSEIGIVASQSTTEGESFVGAAQGTLEDGTQFSSSVSRSQFSSSVS